MRAKSGYIGDDTTGFSINANSISNGTQGAKESVYLGTDLISLGDTFKVSNTGELTASKGKIASWYFTDGAFYNQTAKNAADKKKEVGYGEWNDETKKYNRIYENGMYFGNGGIRFGSNFHVGSNGWMYATAGTIGGWEIGSNTLKSHNKDGKLILNSNGSMSGPGWSIESGGKANFNNIHITGEKSSMSNGTIGGGTSMKGGTIHPGSVGVPGGGNLNDWCKNIVAESVTADYIKGKI